MTKSTSLNNQKPPAEPLGEILCLSWYQDCREVLLYCSNCDDIWLDFIPRTMPLHQIECEECLEKGFVTDRLPPCTKER